MQNTQNTKPTLFARYKSFINSCWNQGKTEYTASELNLNVGTYENETWWKRANNNPYYSTRCYQAALKELGCVTMIKRGLWKINAPIPEWFGSFHFSGLKGRIDKNCFYWHNLLPAEHKVNPFADLKLRKSFPANVEGSKAFYDAALIPVEEIVLTTKVAGLTCDFEVSTDRDNDASINAEIVDYTLFLHETQIGYSTAQELCKAYGISFDTALSAAMDIAKDQAINVVKRNILNAALDAAKAANEVAAKPAEKTYTESEVKEILKRFTETAYEEVLERAIENALEVDASECVEINVDWGFQLDVTLDTRRLATDVWAAVSEGLEEALDAFTIEPTNENN